MCIECCLCACRGADERARGVRRGGSFFAASERRIELTSVQSPCVRLPEAQEACAWRLHRRRLFRGSAQTAFAHTPFRAQTELKLAQGQTESATKLSARLFTR